MHMICYMSNYTGSVEATKVLKDIVDVAKVRNKKCGITGVLFFQDGKFLQVIEGEESDLRDLMADLEKDVRHDNIDILVDTAVEMRGFNDWHMDSLALNEGQKFEADMMKSLTKNFEKNLLPRSDTLVYFYKSLLSQPTYKTQIL